MAFSPRRLTVARQRRMLSKKELAAKTGVSDKTVSRCEAGISEPTEANVQAFSKALDYPVAFFLAGDIEEATQKHVSFRSQTAMSAAVRDAALSAGSIGFLISGWVEDRFQLPAVNVPDLHFYEPEIAARTLRYQWTLGEKPITNMIHLLESKGVRVFSLAENSKRVNAFSLWRDNKPYVFLNTFKSSESSRYDAAHELGHLTLHQGGGMTGRQAEEQANRFAAAFLMPKSDVLAEMRCVYSLEHIIAAKKRWIVSTAALNYRLHQLGITTEHRYRDFCIRMAKLGYNVNEPNEARRETSVVWLKVLTALWKERLTKTDIAADLSIPESEVDALIFGIMQSGEERRPPAGPILTMIPNKEYA